MARPRDPLTLDLFVEVPRPAAPTAASMDYRIEVAHQVSLVLKAAAGDRYAVAAEMSRLAGKEVTKLMLDAYSSEARETFNLPFYLVPALETACGSHVLTSWLADKRGARLYVGREALKAELGRLESQREELNSAAREIKRRLGESE